MRRLALALALLVLALLALPAAGTAAPGDPTAPTLRGSWTARLMVATVARSAPRANARAVQRLSTTAPWAGGRTQLMVLGSKRDTAGELWLRVALARRPNGASGWIPADVVRLARTPWRIEVATATRTVTVRRAGRVVRRFPAVVGKPSTPTPKGVFAVAELFERGSPNDFYGPYVLAITAFSPAFERFGGGPGVVGIHGRGGASLATPLGTAGSHGCVRIDNGQITFLARVAVPGTPVVVR